MKRLIQFLFIYSLPLGLYAQNTSCKNIHQTPIATLEENVQTPPTDFANHVIWGLEGEMSLKTIRHDLDSIYNKGFRSVILEAGYNLPFPYLSDKWFEKIKTITQEVKKRRMKMWIIDEGKYPSGFAGGKFTRERPDLRMQALVVCDTIKVRKGEVIAGQKIDDHVISAVAVSLSGANNRIVTINNHTLDFQAGLDNWNIMLVRADFRTSATRSVNNPTQKKDGSNSLADYLSPIAIQQFIDWTHEQYKKHIGKYFGTTIMGFRGDEPDFAYTPWTPEMIKEFQLRKKYDPAPYLASFFAPVLTEKEKQVKADYWDVWSELFAKNFFQLQADWCESNGLAYVVHLNKEDDMPSCIKSEGDFFRDQSRVQVPGVDAIWNQIWPDTINDYPKLASSVSHIYGKPRAFSESFAAYYSVPTIPEAKYVIDYQYVRGINFFEFMFWPSGSVKPSWMSAPGMKGLNEYANRMSYLLAQGKPGARIGMYFPTTSMWMGDNSVNDNVKRLTHTLLQHQYDFDYINEDAFSDALTVGEGFLQNKSGQRYYTIIIPSTDVISRKAWNMLQAFAKKGGKLLFWGKRPYYLVGNTFTELTAFPDCTNALYEPTDSWTSTVSYAMPTAEFSITGKRNVEVSRSYRGPKPDPTKEIRYIHRTLPDAELYFIFNEGDTDETFSACLDGVGTLERIDAETGKILPLDFSVKNNLTQTQMTLKAHESTVLTLKHPNKEYDITQYGAKGDDKTVNTQAIQQAIDDACSHGGGTIVVPEGTFLTGALFFRNSVNLEIKKNAVLKGTVNAEDYPVIPTRFEGTEQEWKCALLNFDQSKGVKVFGEGTVDGQGTIWAKVPFGETGRPRMFCFTHCDGGSIKRLHLKDHASWCVHVLYTDSFTIDGLDIRAEHHIPSSDGIDIDSSSDILVNNTYIDVNDDCISIKSGKDSDGRRVGRPSENILVQNCHFAYGHGGVALGSEVSGDIRNVTVKDCFADSDNWSPIRIKSQPARGGVIENITYENLTLNNTRGVFDINMQWRLIPPFSPEVEKPTELKNIHFINIKGSSKSMGNIIGLENNPISDLHFENCHIETAKPLKLSYTAGLDLTGLGQVIK
ncbi:glycosyl hydrolase [uncultured Bacteroides sp.]|uniref:glycosyl hydrolase n=1 Tax=uncultured Bacteroides sp. TaxID=162156 RepID=UPI002AA64D7B|nr:glycosyl hydrolase [uncultured Bacteroides sp.]